MDGAADRRRPQGRRHVALAPGAAVGDADEPGAPRRPRAMAAQLPARGAVRRGRPPGARRSARSRPSRSKRMGSSPHANGGELLRDLALPEFRAFGVDVPRPGATTAEATRVLGRYLAEVMRLNAAARNFRIVGPDETASNRLGDVFEVTDRAWMGERTADDDHLAADGRVMEILSRARLPGVARGLPADRSARPVLVLRGVRPHRRLDVQPAREVAEDRARHPVAAAGRVAQLPAHVTRRGGRTTTASRTRTPGSSTTS